MRVGVIGPTYPDSFADNIAHCLPALGAEAVSLGPATPQPRNSLVRNAVDFVGRQSAETQEWLQRPLAHRAQDASCDVIINVQQSLMPTTVAAIKSAGARIALWYPDHLSIVSRMAMFAGNYDRLLLKDPLFVDRLARVYGFPAVYMPEACNPDWHRPIGTPGSESFIVVVGSLYPTRARLLQRLYDAGIPLRLYGRGFPRWYEAGPLMDLPTNRYLAREEKSRVFREARGVLNNLHPAEMNSVNARLFEATAAEGAVLCESRQSLGGLFDVGNEVLSFSSFEELVQQCRMLLEDDAIGRAIGDRASIRAHADHTYMNRLSAILEMLS